MAWFGIMFGLILAINNGIKDAKSDRGSKVISY
jgi:hypothetical protein